MPYPAANRIYPADNRLYPVRAGDDPFFFSPGSSARRLLGETYRPFWDLVIDPDVTLSLLEYKAPGDVSFTTVTIGSHADIPEAARFVSGTPTAFGSGTWTLQATDSTGLVRVNTVKIDTDVRIAQQLITIQANITVRPFASATFARTVTDVAAVKYSVSGAATVAKVAIPRKTLLSGTHDGGNNEAALTDTTATFTGLPVAVGDTVANTTDGSEGTISAIGANTLTATLAGGTDDDWDTSDAYVVYRADTLISRVRDFEYKPSATGIHTITLFVEDSSANEYSATVRVQVS